MNWLSQRMNTPFHTPQIKVHQLSDGFHFVLELTFFHFTLLLEKVYQTTSQPLPHILFTKSSIKSAARSTNWIVSSLAVKKNCASKDIAPPFGKAIDVREEKNCRNRSVVDGRVNWRCHEKEEKVHNPQWVPHC